MFNTVPLRSAALSVITDILHAENITFKILPTNYSDLVTRFNATKQPKWLILLENHPAGLIAYIGTAVRFQFIVASNPAATTASVRGLGLRKRYPYHRVSTSSKAVPSDGLLVKACISHMEPVITLIDSLRAAECIWRGFNNND